MEKKDRPITGSGKATQQALERSSIKTGRHDASGSFVEEQRDGGSVRKKKERETSGGSFTIPGTAWEFVNLKYHNKRKENRSLRPGAEHPFGSTRDETHATWGCWRKGMRGQGQFFE